MAIYGQNYGQILAKFLAIILVTPTTLCIGPCMVIWRAARLLKVKTSPATMASSYQSVDEMAMTMAIAIVMVMAIAVSIAIAL